MANRFMTPKETYLGADALQSALPAIAKLGKKPLIVAGKTMVQQGHVQALQQSLEGCGLKSAVFADIPSEPTDSMIQTGAQVYRDEGCDFLIGFGGGSPMDSAKAIGILVTSGGKLSDYMGKSVSTPLPPLVEIPTTAGTGSECTPFTIITDVAKEIKMLLKGDALMPTVAVVDPVYTIGCTASITVATGLDALTHAVEAYTSKKSFCESDLFALSAVRRIFTYLPKALTDGSDPIARREMALAAYEAGISFANSSVTVVHGMSRPIGALFHVPHGISNAMLLKECLAYVVEGACDRFADLARAIGAALPSESDRAATDAFILAVDELCHTCHVPTLKEYGISRDAFMAAVDKMAEDALASGSPANTRKPLDKEDIINIYRSLW